MADKQDKSEIKVTDRRLFTSEGELRPDAAAEAERQQAEPQPQVIAPLPPPAQDAPPAGAHMQVAESSPAGSAGTAPLPPTAAEQQASRDAFHAAGRKVDEAVRQAHGPEPPEEPLDVSFEGFLASLYMSAMFQLGLLHEQGQRPQVDLVGARHTIDTISMLEEKTRGNLNENEKAVAQDCLFRLRMAFVEMTNALTHPPEPGGPASEPPPR